MDSPVSSSPAAPSVENVTSSYDVLVMIRERTKIDRALLAKLPNLKRLVDEIEALLDAQSELPILSRRRKEIYEILQQLMDGRLLAVEAQRAVIARPHGKDGLHELSCTVDLLQASCGSVLGI